VYLTAGFSEMLEFTVYFYVSLRNKQKTATGRAVLVGNCNGEITRKGQKHEERNRNGVSNQLSVLITKRKEMFFFQIANKINVKNLTV